MASFDADFPANVATSATPAATFAMVSAAADSPAFSLAIFPIAAPVVAREQVRPFA
jgi:hypothetical protein